MRHENRCGFGREVGQKSASRFGLCAACGAVGEEGVERWQGLDIAKAEEFGCLQASTPLTREDAVDFDPVSAKGFADGASLGATTFVKITLGLTVAEREISWISCSRCHRVTHHGDDAAVA